MRTWIALELGWHMARGTPQPGPLGRGVGPSGPVAPADAIGVVWERSADDAVADLVPQSRCFGWADFWTIYLRPAPL